MMKNHMSSMARSVKRSPNTKRSKSRKTSSGRKCSARKKSPLRARHFYRSATPSSGAPSSTSDSSPDDDSRPGFYGTPSKKPRSVKDLGKEMEKMSVSSSEIAVDKDGLTPHMRQLVSLLLAKDDKVLHLIKRAITYNLNFKAEKYEKILSDEERRLEDEVARVKDSQEKFKEFSGVKDDNNDWDNFDKLSDELRTMDKKLRTFRDLRQRAADKLIKHTWAVDDPIGYDSAKRELKELRQTLLDKVWKLTQFSNQPDVIDAVAELILCFYNEPNYIQNKYINFMLTGAPGTGKTTLCRVISDVLSTAGFFLEGDILEASRSDFIGQYLGETAPKTLGFLMRGLDRGVIFVDEAYALCPRDPKDNKPDAYGTEFASALVQFMSTYKGLYCIITAGYKDKMNEDFLPCNDGLARRMYYRFDLADSTPDFLVNQVFKRQLLELLGIAPPKDQKTYLVSTDYFTPRAWEFLEAMVEYGHPKANLPAGNAVAALFENQAGSMSNLAEAASTHLLTRREKVLESAAPKRGGREGHNYVMSTDAQTGKNLPQLKLDDMRAIVRKRVRQSVVRDVDAAMRDVDEAEAKLLPKLEKKDK